jgi:hypothetical protein
VHRQTTVAHNERQPLGLPSVVQRKILVRTCLSPRGGGKEVRGSMRQQMISTKVDGNRGAHRDSVGRGRSKRSKCWTRGAVRRAGTHVTLRHHVLTAPTYVLVTAPTYAREWTRGTVASRQEMRAQAQSRWVGGRVGGQGWVCCVHNVNHSSSALSGQPLISTDHEKNF